MFQLSFKIYLLEVRINFLSFGPYFETMQALEVADSGGPGTSLTEMSGYVTVVTEWTDKSHYDLVMSAGENYYMPGNVTETSSGPSGSGNDNATQH
jgi:hypothetical protein